MSAKSLVEEMKRGLDAPICLTWELTYACNLQCVHCLSSSGQRDERELSTEEAKKILDDLRDLQVFYINIGGGEPMVRRDFFELLEYSVGNGIGVKFSTNGAFIDEEKAQRLAAMDYLDIQISLDGVDAATNDAVRGEGSHAMAIRAMDNLKAANFGQFKISVVVTRHNVSQLDEFKALADFYGAQLRITRLRPAGRGADTWHELHPTNAQQREIYDWLLKHGENVLTGDCDVIDPLEIESALSQGWKLLDVRTESEHNARNTEWQHESHIEHARQITLSPRLHWAREQVGGHGANHSGQKCGHQNVAQRVERGLAYGDVE